MTSTDTHSESPVQPTGGALATIMGHGALTPTLPWPYALPSRPEILTSKPSPSQLLHSLRRRWILAVGLGIVAGSLLAGTLWFLVPVRYEAAAYLQVFASSRNVGSEGEVSVGDYSSYKRTQAALMSSPRVLLAALRNPEIQRLKMVQRYSDDPSAWLAGQLVVEYPGDAEIMRVSMKGDRPGDLKQIVDAVTEAFIQEIVQAGLLERNAQIETLRASYEGYLNDIGQKLKLIHNMSKEMGTETSEQAQLRKKVALDEVSNLMQRMEVLHGDINDLDLEIFRAELKAKNMAQMDLPAHYVDEHKAKDPTITRLVERAAKLEEALAVEIDRSADPARAPSVRRWRNDLESVRQKLEDREIELRAQLAERIKSGGDFTSQIEGLKAEKTELETRLNDARNVLNKKVQDVGKLDQFSAEYVQQQQQLKSLQELAGKLDTTLKMRDLEMRSPPRVVLREKAQLPSTSDALRKYFTVGFSGVLGFGLVLFGVAFLEFQARRLNSRREIHEGLGLRVLGDLPSFAGRAWRRHAGRARLQAALAESIDSIRTALIHSRASTPIRVVLITSAEPLEGKTTVASQLAGSLARSGKRTLFVDGDLRNPAAHQVFELPQEPGLCDLLRGLTPREAAIQPTAAANLWLMPAGRCTMQCLQALSNGLLDETISSLRKEFDFIVIDSGPVLSVADPLLLGQHVDAAIVSVLRDVSQMPKVYEAAERLRSVGVAVMGVVVNGGGENPSRYGYELEIAESA